MERLNKNKVLTLAEYYEAKKAKSKGIDSCRPHRADPPPSNSQRTGGMGLVANLEKGFYSVPDPVYKNQDKPLEEIRDILTKAGRVMRNYFFIGVNEAAWDQLVNELEAELQKPYQTAPKPLKTFARRLMDAVCEYLQTKAYDERIPSRAALIKQHDAEIMKALGNLKQA